MNYDKLSNGVPEVISQNDFDINSVLKSSELTPKRDEMKQGNKDDSKAQTLGVKTLQKKSTTGRTQS